MAADIQVFNNMKSFLAFDEADAQNLAALAPIFARHGASITDRFYDVLATFPETAGLIEGRVDKLKATHAGWMAGLFCGEYGEAYFAERMRIGQTHVRIGLDPSWVEGVMSILRAESLTAIMAEISDPAEAMAKAKSALKILDLDIIIINLAYGEERLDRISSFTGMNRKLIENVIRRGGKK